MDQDAALLYTLADVVAADQVNDTACTTRPQSQLHQEAWSAYIPNPPASNYTANGLLKSYADRYQPPSTYASILAPQYAHIPGQAKPVNPRESDLHYAYGHTLYNSRSSASTYEYQPSHMSASTSVPPPVWGIPRSGAQQQLSGYQSQIDTRSPFHFNSQPRARPQHVLRNVYPRVDFPVSKPVNVTIPLADLQALAYKKHADTKSTTVTGEDQNIDPKVTRNEDRKIEAPVPIRYHEMQALLTRAPNITLQDCAQATFDLSADGESATKDLTPRLPSPDTLIALTEPYLLDWCFDDEMIKKLNEMAL